VPPVQGYLAEHPSHDVVECDTYGGDLMISREFSRIRHHLEKTQIQMAQLLGVSCKAVQSFEQGWRKIPVHIERQALFLLALKSANNRGRKPCWAIKECSTDARNCCPAWEFKAGQMCWLINGTVCHGEVRKSWSKKMTLCKKCEVFQSAIPSI
jgi:DNA-binding XRE family transcriptional regulator